MAGRALIILLMAPTPSNQTLQPAIGPMPPSPAAMRAGAPGACVPARSVRQRAARLAVIGGFALLALFLGSCPDGAMAGTSSTSSGNQGWWYQCPIVRPFIAAE
jgi:hypothetical protein